MKQELHIYHVCYFILVWDSPVALTFHRNRLIRNLYLTFCKIYQYMYLYRIIFCVLDFSTTENAITSPHAEYFNWLPWSYQNKSMVCTILWCLLSITTCNIPLAFVISISYCKSILPAGEKKVQKHKFSVMRIFIFKINTKSVKIVNTNFIRRKKRVINIHQRWIYIYTYLYEI